MSGSKPYLFLGGPANGQTYLVPDGHALWSVAVYPPPQEVFLREPPLQRLNQPMVRRFDYELAVIAEGVFEYMIPAGLRGQERSLFVFQALDRLARQQAHVR